MPENLAITDKSFLITVAKFSGTFRSTYISELSSNVTIIEFSDPSTSSVIPLTPNTPLKGAIIFSLFNFTITSPFFTNSFRFKSEIRLLFSILKVLFFFEIAVPKLSILSENSFFITSDTIIDGGGLLLNFFLK